MYILLPRISSEPAINPDIYCEPLTKLNRAIKEKYLELTNRKAPAFHQDNANPHMSRNKIIAAKLESDINPLWFFACIDRKFNECEITQLQGR